MRRTPRRLQFLLQTLATFDIATRGFLDGTKRYEQQRARADDLEDRGAFRTALVNALQEGFFVVDRDGTIIEVNEAFAAITGCGADGLPYRWPYPWLVDQDDASQRRRIWSRRAAFSPRRPCGTATGESRGRW